MSIQVHLKDSSTGSEVKVTPRGQLITAPLDFSTFFEAEANVINTAFVIVPPITGKRFVITVMDIYANKSVGASDATIEVYEADSPTSTTVDTIVFKREMIKQSSTTLPVLNIIISEGKWVNIKTDDNTIFINISGYYVNV